MASSKRKKPSPFSFLEGIDKTMNTPTSEEAKVHRKVLPKENTAPDDGQGVAVPARRAIAGTEAVYIDPSLITPWKYANRQFFTESEMQDLKESLRTVGQSIPALVRPCPTGDFEYELIYGARRLRAANEIGQDLLVLIKDIDDAAAAVEMDAENRARADITPYERGCDYKRWIENGVFKNAAGICAGTGEAKSKVSKLLQIGSLPQSVPLAFASPTELSFSFAYELAKSMGEDPAKKVALDSAAKKIAGRAKDQTDTEARKRRLLAATCDGDNAAKDRVVTKTDGMDLSIPGGAKYGRMNISRTGEIKIRVNPLPKGSDIGQVTEKINNAITEILLHELE